MTVMLTKLNEAEVTSSEGFKIKYGRDTLTYIESSRYLIVPIEHLGDPYEMVVYLRMAGTWMQKGKAGEPVSNRELDIVSQRIAECLRFLGGGSFSIDR